MSPSHFLRSFALGGRLWLHGYVFGPWNGRATRLRRFAGHVSTALAALCFRVPLLLAVDLLLLPLAVAQTLVWGPGWATALPRHRAAGLPIAGGQNLYLRAWAYWVRATDPDHQPANPGSDHDHD